MPGLVSLPASLALFLLLLLLLLPPTSGPADGRILCVSRLSTHRFLSMVRDGSRPFRASLLLPPHTATAVCAKTASCLQATPVRAGSGHVPRWQYDPVAVVAMWLCAVWL